MENETEEHPKKTAVNDPDTAMRILKSLQRHYAGLYQRHPTNYPWYPQTIKHMEDLCLK